MRFLLFVSALMVALGSQSRAQPSELEKCGEANSTVEIVQCLVERTNVWDRRLNAAYQKLLPAVPADQREKLRAAERLWVQYRDANCAFYAAGEGSISRIDAAECVRRMTQERAQELEALLN